MKTEKFLPAPRERAPEKSGFRFPGPRDRVTINGMTGSGKSTFAMWLFAESADFDKKPWVFLDFKGEDLIQTAVSEGMFIEQPIGKRLSDKPGAYVVSHNPRNGMQPVIDFLWRVYEAGRTGLFLDEATMVPELRGEANSGGPFQSILSQGRSKEIPCWVLAQRPVNVNRMVFSENQFYSAFRLGSKRDFEAVAEEIPEDSEGYHYWERPPKLKAHWSLWYDREADRTFMLRPCPPPDRILDILWERLDKMKKRI